MGEPGSIDQQVQLCSGIFSGFPDQPNESERFLGFVNLDGPPPRLEHSREFVVRERRVVRQEGCQLRHDAHANTGCMTW